MSRGFRPKPGSSSNPQPLLKDQLNPEHPLVKLSQAIDWRELAGEFGQTVSSEGGRPTLPTRLLVGVNQFL
jgi:IS5 family transposase